VEASSIVPKAQLPSASMAAVPPSLAYLTRGDRQGLAFLGAQPCVPNRVVASLGKGWPLDCWLCPGVGWLQALGTSAYLCLVSVPSSRPHGLGTLSDPTCWPTDASEKSHSPCVPSFLRRQRLSPWVLRSDPTRKDEEAQSGLALAQGHTANAEGQPGPRPSSRVEDKLTLQGLCG
jgi:hypothetical protein